MDFDDIVKDTVVNTTDIEQYEKSRVDKNRAITQLNEIIEYLEKSLMK